MRITFVMPTLEVSGGARVFASHAEALEKRGHEVLLVAPRAHPLTIKQRVKKLLGRDILVTETEKSSIFTSSVPHHFPKHLSKIIEEDVPDADIIIGSWWSTIDWIKDFAPSKGLKTHFIQGWDGLVVPEDGVDAVWRLPMRKIAVSQWLVDLGRERFGIDEIALVPNAVDDDFRLSGSRQKQAKPTIGFLFHSAPFKGMDIVREAVAGLDARLLCFGTMIPERGALPPGADFHHLPSREKIGEIYRSCDVWLSASRMEGFNLTPLEAMASGTPAICSKTGRPLEIIQNGVNGYLVDAGDAESFAQAALKILNLSKDRWQAMSDAARNSVAHPTWDESSALFEAALLDARSTVA